MTRPPEDRRLLTARDSGFRDRRTESGVSGMEVEEGGSHPAAERRSESRLVSESLMSAALCSVLPRGVAATTAWKYFSCSTLVDVSLPDDTAIETGNMKVAINVLQTLKQDNQDQI